MTAIMADARRIERAQVREQVGGRLDQVAARRQVEDLRRIGGARRQHRAEGEQRLAGLNPVGVEAQAGARRIVRGELARRHRGDAVLDRAGALRRGLRQRVAERRFDLCPRQAARPQQDRPVEAGHDGGFDADRGRPAVDDEVDAAAQIGQHMRRGGGRDMAGAVRRRRHHRLAEGRQNGARDRVIGHPQRDGGQPGGRELRDRAIGPLGHHQGEGARPQRLRQPRRIGIEVARAGRRRPGPPHGR